MSKKKKEKYVDDGHTIYNMDIDGMPNRRDNGNRIGLNKKEKKALIKAALQRYMPIVLMTILCFGLTMLLMYFWLR